MKLKSVYWVLGPQSNNFNRNDHSESGWTAFCLILLSINMPQMQSLRIFLKLRQTARAPGFNFKFNACEIFKSEHPELSSRQPDRSFG